MPGFLPAQEMKAEPGREVIPLDGRWQFRKDSSRRDVSQEEKKWRNVMVPHTWNNLDIQSGKGYYAGDAAYRKELEAPLAWKDKRVFIRFEGVGVTALLFVNGKNIGQHKGSYSAWAFDISYALQFGEKNLIEVRVNNEEKGEIIPVNSRLFGIYGGIYRPVSLIVTNKVNIAVTDYASPGVYLRQKEVSSTGAEIDLSVKVENMSTATPDLVMHTEIYSQEGRRIQEAAQSFKAGRQGMSVLAQQIKMKNPHLWNGKKDAYLYKVVVSLRDGDRILDQVTQPLGVRRIDLVGGKGVFLNGQAYPLHGVCRHQEIQDEGNALTNQEHLSDLQTIDEMGATAIRLAHYQQAEYLYARCDSMGFLVWAEIPFVNAASGLESDNARQQLTELIRQNFNHPSIFIWGLHNEVYGKTPGDYVPVLTRQLNDIAKTEDSGRPTVSVSGYGEMDRPSNLNADVQGMNRYYGWYEGAMGDLDGWVKGLASKYPDYKVMLSEYGAEGNVGSHGESGSDHGGISDPAWPESYQTHFHEVQWGILSRQHYLLGSFVWNMFDFSVPAAHGGGVPARNMKGLVSYDRKTRKDAYYWYKANWNPAPMVYITGRRLGRRSSDTVEVTVYSNLTGTELFVNDHKQDSFRLGTTGVHYIFSGVQLQKGKNVIRAEGVRDGKTYKDQIEWEY